MTRKSVGGGQAALLLALATLAGFAGNGFREKPLPLSGALEEPPPPEPGAALASTPAEDALVRWEEGALFLDVRERPEYDAARVAGAIWVGPTDFQERYFEVLAAFDLAMPMFVYGAGPDSHRVRRVAADLAELGHADVELAVCGLSGLGEAGVDVETGPGGMP